MNNSFKKFSKKIAVSMLVFIMMLTSIMPVWASEVPVPDFSQWALSSLNESERFGTYPIEWYYDNFRSEITQARMEVLLTNTSNKIEELSLNKNENFKPLPYENTSSREDFLIRLYNVIAQYDISLEDDPIAYFQNSGVLLGTTNGLELKEECTTEQAVVFTTRLIENLFKEFDGGGKGFAWKVESNGNKIYFLGSIHIGKNIIYPVNQRLKNAFAESDALIVEANIFDQTGGLEYFIEKAMYQDGSTIKDAVSEETYNKLLKVLEMYGIPAETYNVFKPWSIANDLNVISMSNLQNLEGAAQSANLGVDVYFLSNALVSEKPIIELEGIKFQADLFDGLSKEVQEKYLNAIIDNILNPDQNVSNESGKLLEEWLIQWKNGDVEGFKESYVSTSSSEAEDDYGKELNDMLFGERDKNMATKIIEILESEDKGTYFVVVGAGHFVVENTVIDHLIEKGYNVEILK